MEKIDRKFHFVATNPCKGDVYTEVEIALTPEDQDRVAAEQDCAPVLWADEHDKLIDKKVRPRDCECYGCGPSAAVYAKVTDESLYDWRCASCGYTPESVDGE